MSSYYILPTSLSSSIKVHYHKLLSEDGQEFFQVYDDIRNASLADGVLFEDASFPANDSSLFFSESTRNDIKWMRPSEFCDDPHFFVDGVTRFDVKQGELGNCWFLAAAANLTLNTPLFHKIVPEDNSFQENYAGIFHFRFWQYGRWIDIIVDDRLPTIHGRLLYTHSDDSNEFWSALLEKAYAKLHGCYEALKGGTTCEALEDFTGGVSESHKIEDEFADKLFKIVRQAFHRSSFLGCSIQADPSVTEAQTAAGLVRGHAYSITDVKLVPIESSEEVKLLRIRNPWGNSTEWKMAWSDGSEEWGLINDDTKINLNLTFDTDGEFWMSYKDFTDHFDRLDICNLSPDFVDGDAITEGKIVKWNAHVFEGSWVPGATAGGCRNYIETFACNPQYVIELRDPDEDDDEAKCTVIVGLMQKNRRQQKKSGVGQLSIGYGIYQITNDADETQTPLTKTFFQYNASIAKTTAFSNLREVSERFKLLPGKYVIVPSTFEPNKEGEFIIRVFSEGKGVMIENDEQLGFCTSDDKEETSDPVLKSAAEKLFKAVAPFDGEEIGWACLQKILNDELQTAFQFDGFSKDVCRSMVAMLDTDWSGKLSMSEFIALWQSIKTWQNVFTEYDEDSTGSLSSFELRQALKSVGYNVSKKVIESLVLRYGDGNGQIAFDDFITCAVKLKSMINIFHEKDSDGDENSAVFTIDEWVEKTIYS